MIARQAAPQLQALAQWYPVLAVTGPRQSGKTTLVQATFPGKPYVSLEDPDVLAGALSDPRRFLGQFPAGAILDEAQRAPELFSYLQSIVDRDRAMGAWVAGVRSAQEPAISSLRGPLFETWAVAEALKLSHHLRLDARLFFWRDKIGSEVDLLIERAQQVQTVEIKAGQTVAGDWFAALRKYEALRSAAASQPEPAAQVLPQPRPVLVYAGSVSQTRDLADVCPWQQWPARAAQLLQSSA